jgi:hypothetical protein
MTHAQRDFSHRGKAGDTYGVRIILDRHAETGMYNGHAQIFRGQVENSAFLTNDLTIEPFVAVSEDEAFELALRGVHAHIEQVEWVARDVNV